MRIKYLFWLLTLTFGTISLISIFMNSHEYKDKSLDLWIGEYWYEEYIPPNIGRMYSITIYENEGLFAYIKIDGFQILKRLKAKVQSKKDQLIFEFYDYYTDEGGSYTIHETYNKGDIL